MKKFLLENPTIAFGLGLPLLLVAFFLLASGVPTLLVDPPRHEVLYATGYGNFQHGVRIAVSGGKVVAAYHGNTLPYQPTRLWRFNPATGGVTELALELPPDLFPPGKAPTGSETAARVAPVNVPDLAALTVNPSSIAPDGYEFATGSDGPSGFLFMGGRYRNQAFLRKDGRRIALPSTESPNYGMSTQFIGWVVTP